MTRKFTIELNSDGTAVVESETDVKYATYERGIEVLLGLINTVLPKKTPPAPVIVKKPVPDPTFEEIERERQMGLEAEAVVAGINPAQAPLKKHGGSQGHKGNKYGIPTSLYKTDKHEYQRLWAICKAHSLTYEQALTWKKLPSRTKGDQKGKKPHKNDPNTSPGQKAIRELILAKNGPLHAGQQVRHNGAKASPLFGKAGEILKIGTDGQVFVRFGESTAWLQPHSIAVIPEPS